MSESGARFAACPLSSPGTDPEVWASAAAELPHLDVSGWARVVVAVAHPDDEVLGAGAIIADLAARGASIETIIVSRGEGAIPGLDAESQEQLAHERRDESTRAAEVLGAPTPLFLGLPDGGLQDHEFRISEAIAAAMRRMPTGGARSGVGETVVLTHWVHDGHPDHEAVGRAAAAAVERVRHTAPHTRLVSFPVWALHWDTPQDGIVPWARAARAELDPAAFDRKTRAARVFRSQNAPWPDESSGDPVMPAHVVQRLLEVPEWVILDSFAQPREAVDSRAHLEGLYSRNTDPWGLETSAYEADKRDATLAALPRERYRFCFEPGCSVGVLTLALARRADRVEAWDPVDRALDRARERVAARVRDGDRDAQRVTLVRRALTTGDDEQATQLGPRGADLIVLSEMLYFIPHAELRAILTGLVERAEPGAHIVAVHWRHPVAGWPEGGSATHDVLLATPGLTHLRRDAASADYLIDVCAVAPR